MSLNRAAVFAAVLGLTRAASAGGDFWAQSDYCAQVKGATDEQPVKYTDETTKVTTTHGSRDGARACAWHCLTYTATQALTVAAGARLLGIRLHPGAAATAALLSGATHYIADRRVPDGVLETLARKSHKHRFFKLADHGMNGAFHLDAAWHHAWETAAALIATTGATTRKAGATR